MRTLRGRDMGEEREKGGPTKELGEEESGMGLGLWALDAFQALPQHALLAAPFS